MSPVGIRQEGGAREFVAGKPPGFPQFLSQLDSELNPERSAYKQYIYIYKVDLHPGCPLLGKTSYPVDAPASRRQGRCQAKTHCYKLNSAKSVCRLLTSKQESKLKPICRNPFRATQIIQGCVCFPEHGFSRLNFVAQVACVGFMFPRKVEHPLAEIGVSKKSETLFGGSKLNPNRIIAKAFDDFCSSGVATTFCGYNETNGPMGGYVGFCGCGNWLFGYPVEYLGPAQNFGSSWSGGMLKAAQTSGSDGVGSKTVCKSVGNFTKEKQSKNKAHFQPSATPEGLLFMYASTMCVCVAKGA